MNHLYCGVDIAKETVVFCLINPDGQPLGKAATFKNNGRGFREADKWIRKLAKPLKPFDIHVCMEATNVYFLSAAKYFYRQTGIIVSVVNPAQVKHFSDADLQRTKTDEVDACAIARFTRAMNPRPWTPPAPHEEEMIGIIRHIDTLKEMKQAELNRLEDLEIIGDSTADVQKAVKEHVAFIENQISDLGDKLKDVVKNAPEASENIKLLCSIPGIAEDTACKLIAEMGDISRYDSVKQLVASAGLAPAEKRSGKSVRGKSSINKRGSRRLRKSLYMPAVVAIRYNPVVKDLYQRLLAAGKHKMLAIVACMRKLLHIAYGVLKNKKQFDAAWCS